MQPAANRSQPKVAPAKPAETKPPEIASASVSDTLSSLKVNPDTGLARAEVDVRRNQSERLAGSTRHSQINRGKVL